MLYTWIFAILWIIFEVIGIIFFHRQLSYVFFPSLVLVLFPCWRYLQRELTDTYTLRNIQNISLLETWLLLGSTMIATYMFSLTFPVGVLCLLTFLSLLSYIHSRILFSLSFVLFMISIIYLIVWVSTTAGSIVLYATYTLMLGMISVVFAPITQCFQIAIYHNKLWRMYIKDIRWLSNWYVRIFPIMYISIVAYIYLQQSNWYVSLGTSLPTILIGLLYLISIFRDIPLDPSKKYLSYNL
jgi:hypothetical protein